MEVIVLLLVVLAVVAFGLATFGIGGGADQPDRARPARTGVGAVDLNPLT